MAASKKVPVNSGISPLFIYFRQDPHLRCVAIIGEQKTTVDFTNDATAIWAISAEGIRWLKDAHKHANTLDEQSKYYQAVDDYVEGLNGLLNLFQPE